MDISLSSHLKTAQYLAHLLESKFKVGNKSFGLDPVLGMIPIWGDVVALIISAYIVWIGLQYRVPVDKVIIMLGNILYDFLIGFIPILGDIADFTHKANTRNLKIIEDHVGEEVFQARVL